MLTAGSAAFPPFTSRQGTVSVGGIPVLQEKYLNNCTHPDDEGNQVSHETIYRNLFIQARGALKKELLQHLRSKRGMRRSRHKTLKGAGLGQITNTVSIRERPASVENRAVPGHWEGDLLM